VRPWRVDTALIAGAVGLHLPDDAREAIFAHAEYCLPLEACGLLAMDQAGAIKMVYSLDNADRSPNRFTISPTQHFGALLHAERHAWEIGGVFHSHPGGPASLSSTDRAQPHDPTWIHVVVGFSPRLHLRAWRISTDTVSEVPIT
jgi:proteasome lid subunit RPN8/RPN11